MHATGLKLAYLDQAGLDLAEICLPLPPDIFIKDVCHHARPFSSLEMNYLCLYFIIHPNNDSHQNNAKNEPL